MFFFLGAFAYADDVALLAPTIMALNKLSNVCVSFAREYHVLFDPIKGKLIAFNCATTEDIYVTFDGEKIQITLYIVGDCNNENRIQGKTYDFIRRANTVMSQFKLAPTSINYKLFKSFCSSLYVFYSGLCQQSRSISFICIGENACVNCIHYLI